MTEEMVGGQHRNDESDTDLGVTGEHANVKDRCSENLAHGCASRRPTPRKKVLATADLVRDSPLIGT